jgi:hypothetical protein
LAELEARGVKLSAKNKKDLKEHKLASLLCQHEVTRLQEQEERYVKYPKREVPTIKPLSVKNEGVVSDLVGDLQEVERSVQ